MSATFIQRLLPIAGLVIAVAAMGVVYHTVRGIDLQQLTGQIYAYTPARVTAAGACMLMALILYGIYEAILLKRFNGSIGVIRPFMAATIANTIGHSVGLSTLSSGALRYRIYAPLGLSHPQIGAVIVLNTLPFILGLGLLLDLALIFDAPHAAQALHLPIAAVLTLGLIGLAKDVAYPVLTATCRAPFKMGPFNIRLPDLQLTAHQLWIGVAEMICVALILYLFMPPELGMGFTGFLAIYIIACVAGSLSNVPAGLGVFEAALLLMLPQVPKEKLLAAVIVYRAIYELLPLLLAFGLLTSYEIGSRHGIAGRLWRARSPH